ncbi:MAG: amino acid adenylation domain-containing protein [Chloroflexota bacterium]
MSASYPLSQAQLRQWFLAQLHPESPIHWLVGAYRLNGELDMAVFKHSLSDVAERQAALRTIFAIDQDHPQQSVCPQAELPLEQIPMGHVLPDQWIAETERLALQESRRPADPGQSPLWKVTLLEFAPTVRVLLFAIHRLLADLPSIDLFIRDLFCTYAGCSQGQPSPQASLSWTKAEAEWLAGPEAWKELDDWKRGLSNVQPAFTLPIARPRPSIQTFKGSQQAWHFPPDLLHAVCDAQVRLGCDRFTILLAGFQALLYRYTFHADLLIGSKRDRRPHTGLSGTIGNLTNFQVIRTGLSGNPTFRELVQRAGQAVSEARQWERLPFEVLLANLNLERTMQHSPLFQVVFQFDEAKPAAKPIPGLTISPLDVDLQWTEFDLSLLVREDSNGLRGVFEYDPQLFDADTIDRLIGHYQTLFAGAVQALDTPITALPLLTKAEFHQIFTKWNATQTEKLPQARLHELFEAQARLTPEAQAIVFENQCLTYAQVDTRANRLAHALQRSGIGPGSVVAILQDRSPELPISILAALKAGAAYLPIDIHNPLERILYSLDNSHAQVLLTHSHVIDGFPFTRLQKLCDLEDTLCLTAPRPQIKDLDSLPFPDRRLVDYRKYDRYLGHGCTKMSISLLSTRGCPYRCVYCHKLWPKTHAHRSAQNIFEEVLIQYEKGYRTFKFVDDIFNLNRRNCESFFDLVLKHHLKARFQFSNGVRGDLLTPDLIDLMSEAGVMYLGMALETASPRLQRLIGKNLNIEKLRENLNHVCQKHPHIIVDLFLMFGFPTETEAEALMTLDFIKSIRWTHFPYLFTVRIYPNTDLARLAMDLGVSKELIERSAHLAYHEPGETLPFSRTFIRDYQSSFTKDYFLLPERLESVIPNEKKVLTREEIVAKYNSYLPGILESYPQVAELIGEDGFYEHETLPSYEDYPQEYSGETTTFSVPNPDGGKSLRVLLLDLSQHFSSKQHLMGDVVEQPLGLLYLMSTLTHQFGSRIHGKIVKALIDFDSFEELRQLLADFQPDVIGLRTLSLYRDFFHETVALIRQWQPQVTMVAGGPYATSEYNVLLSDHNLDVVVVGEGEVTFAELIGKILENQGRLPADTVLAKIAGIAFMPMQSKTGYQPDKAARLVLELDHLEQSLAQMPSDAPPALEERPDLAYVMYTSGSTGQPKGVAMRHTPLVNLIEWEKQTTGLKQPASTLQFAPISFDVSCQELFFTWATGGKLVLISEDTRRDPEALLRTLHAHQIERLFLPFVALQHLTQTAAELHLEVPASLCEVITAGEQLQITPQIVDFFQKLKNCTLHNQYGPTESHVVSAYTLRGTPDDWPRLPPIGRPIANAVIRLLDVNFQPVPIGVPGELYIGGPVLAQGYIHRPDLTAERFILDPFGQESGARLYRTGDIARYRPDGEIEYLGRLDHQVKVRGFRIELGEIETVLAQHVGVREAVVMAREAEWRANDSSAAKRLVAYIVPQADQAELIPALRHYLKDKLPEYMIPATFVLLETLPLTPSGKVNRRGLPDPDTFQPDNVTSYVAPRTSTEEHLVAIWQKILGVPKIGVYDSFFDLGGDSLGTTQVMTRLRETFQVNISLPVIFDVKTVAGLAELIETVRWIAPKPDSTGFEKSQDREEGEI